MTGLFALRTMGCLDFINFFSSFSLTHSLVCFFINDPQTFPIHTVVGVTVAHHCSHSFPQISIWEDCTSPIPLKIGTATCLVLTTEMYMEEYLRASFRLEARKSWCATFYAVSFPSVLTKKFPLGTIPDVELQGSAQVFEPPLRTIVLAPSRTSVNFTNARRKSQRITACPRHLRIHGEPAMLFSLIFFSEMVHYLINLL